MSRLERDDIEVTRDILDILDERMRCLDHPPEPRLLADLRVVQAVIAFSEERNWEGPLAAALRIRPTVDRIVGRAHPIYAWEPPDPTRFSALSPGSNVYLDGKRVNGLPTDPGWYVVQRTNGEVWNTSLLREAPPSMLWANGPVETPVALELDAWFSLVGGGALSLQNTAFPGTSNGAISVYDLNPAPFTGDSTFSQRWDPHGLGNYGVRLDGRAWFYGPAGAMLSGEYLFGFGTAFRQARLMGAVKLGAARLGLGLGAGDSLLYRRATALPDQDRRAPFGGDALVTPIGDAVAESTLNGVLAVHLGLTGGARQQADFSLDLGIRVQDIRAEARFLYAFPPGGRSRVALVFGGYLHGGLASFEAVGLSAYSVQTALIQTGLMVGGRFRGRL